METTVTSAMTKQDFAGLDCRSFYHHTSDRVGVWPHGIPKSEGSSANDPHMVWSWFKVIFESGISWLLATNSNYNITL